MCGIAGYVDLAGAPPERSIVETMTAVLGHRGPDGQAVTVLAAAPGPTVVFGHRRLAIIDLSDAAAQPLGNEDGSVTVTYNGEVYNFAELRSQLQAHGHVFRSRSDTEVVVHAYEQFGDAFVERLDGMFAFALWDGAQQRLVLARDRAGKKPLYYAFDGRRLTFGSEIKALRTCPWVDTTVAWERVPQLLSVGYVAWPDTMYRSVQQVPPAAMLVLDRGGLSEPRAYWTSPFARAGAIPAVSRADAMDRAREQLRTAVRRRTVSDVPLGVLLSGGVDSSAIVALMAESGHAVRTFTVGIDGDASYDESRFARQIALRFDTEHTEIKVRADATVLLDRLLWHLDEPFADSSALPTYLIARAAREHVTVALTGDGGDEVFGGYERFAAALLAARLPLAAQRWAGVLGELLPRTGSYFDIGRRISRFAVDAGRPVWQRYCSWLTLFEPALLGRLLSGDISTVDARGGPAADRLAAVWAESEGAPLLHRLLHANFRTYLHDDLLVKSDRMAMANSLEVRSPFLDTTLIETLASLPPEMKATPLSLKRILRRSLRGMLPGPILRRRKHGFGVPIDRWFRGELREPFADYVLASGGRTAPLLNRGVVDQLVEQHMNRVWDHGARLWALLALELWLRMLERPVSAEAPRAYEVSTVGGRR